jgi:threonine dehydrogenase-like Zn-dependent dehydrogenase
MRAAVFNGPGDIGVEERPRPEIDAPTDAIVRVTHTAICGSDLWFYTLSRRMPRGLTPRRFTAATATATRAPRSATSRWVSSRRSATT